MAGSLPVGLPSGPNNDNDKGNGLLLYFHHYSFYSQKVCFYIFIHSNSMPHLSGLLILNSHRHNRLGFSSCVVVFKLHHFVGNSWHHPSFKKFANVKYLIRVVKKVFCLSLVFSSNKVIKATTMLGTITKSKLT